MASRLGMGILAFVLIVGAASAPQASAQDPGCGAWDGGLGFGYFNYSYGTGMNLPRLPYFTLFPPVYYSYPVARPYGWSPFAYPPGTRTPDILPPVEAATYSNPYVPRGEKASSTDKTAGGPRVYLNPFVNPKTDVAMRDAAK